MKDARRHRRDAMTHGSSSDGSENGRARTGDRRTTMDEDRDGNEGHDRDSRAGREVRVEVDAGRGGAPSDGGSERLAAENQRLEDELRREHEKYLRALADFDNYRKRVDRESARAALAGKRELLLALLGFLDDFE